MKLIKDKVFLMIFKNSISFTNVAFKHKFYVKMLNFVHQNKQQLNNT